MAQLHVASTDALSPSFLQDLRQFLNEAFDGDFSDHDWEHAIGGTHVWISAPERLISHGALVERTLVCAGTTLRVGYVEAMATAASHRRHGHGAQVMATIGELISQHYPIGVLSTGGYGFYESLGWIRWRGPTFVDEPRGRTPTPADDGDIMILPTPRSPSLDLDSAIVCDWRPGDVW